MIEIYNPILEKLENEVPELRWIDDQKGQMQFDRPPVNFPAALIEISLPETQNITTKIQNCNAIIVIDFCFDYTGKMSSSAFNKVDREKSMNYWKIVGKATKVLQGFETEIFNQLERIHLNDPLKRAGYKVVSVGFKTTFRENLN